MADEAQTTLTLDLRTWRKRQEEATKLTIYVIICNVMGVMHRSCVRIKPQATGCVFAVIQGIRNPLRGDWIVGNYKHFYRVAGEGSLLWFVTGLQLCTLPDSLACGVTYTSLVRNRIIEGLLRLVNC